MSEPTTIEARNSARDVVFVVGSPRSGTTWLQRLMGAHPAVATTQETELVNRYCGAWYDAWDHQLYDDPDEWRRHRHRGLPAVLTAEELDGYVVGFARGVYDKTLSLKPGASVVVDKNPEYSLHVPLLRRMFPAAGVVHIVRDGRDVTASMLTASRGWGRHWASRQVRLAARTWRANVEGAATAAQSGRYLQVRYEDLLADGARQLQRCLGFAGVAASADECAAIVARFDRRRDGVTTDDSLVWSGEVVRRLGRAPSEPEGFFGEGTVGAWRSWPARDRLEFEVEAGDLLRRLGYATDSGWVGVTPVRRGVAQGVARATASANRLGWRLHLALGRRGVYLHVARIDPYD